MPNNRTDGKISALPEGHYFESGGWGGLTRENRSVATKMANGF